ncbi:L-lactate dehydrogenase [[Mycoplasma] testudinis]|uniref:L-lactate dehydrogenase n=1 Tax=[Mycoplasma] testudinis TaxID=33924 RepID=UPI00047F570D|nr:L-lactate dehydrogenase [[Mycoplasma] testudinis]
MVNTKVVVIGAGNVGGSFLYAAINQGIASSYGIIDNNKKLREGQILDFEDSIWNSQKDFRIFTCDYQDLKDADFVIITAGSSQNNAKSRLDGIEKSIAMMKNIAKQVKKSGFKGFTIIASNPLDIMVYTYLKITKISKNKVIGTGTLLDTARLRILISQKLQVSPKSVEAFTLGEHGDTSFSIFSEIRIGGVPFKNLEKIHGINSSNYESLLDDVVRKRGFEIVSRKSSTNYGIGQALTKILSAIVYDSQEVLPISTYLEGEYGYNDVCISVPAIVGKDGVQKILEHPMNKKERQKFKKSIEFIKSFNKQYV